MYGTVYYRARPDSLVSKAQSPLSPDALHATRPVHMPKEPQSSVVAQGPQKMHVFEFICVQLFTCTKAKVEHFPHGRFLMLGLLLVLLSPSLAVSLAVVVGRAASMSLQRPALSRNVSIRGQWSV